VYSADPAGTVRAASEYVVDDGEAAVPAYVARILDEFSRPVLTDPSTIMAFVLAPAVTESTNTIAQVDDLPAAPTSHQQRTQSLKTTRLPPRRVILKVRNPDGSLYQAPQIARHSEGVHHIPDNSASKLKDQAQGTASDSGQISKQEPTQPVVDRADTPPSVMDDDLQLTLSPEEEILSAVATKLTTVLADGCPEYNLPNCLIGQYATDTFFTQIAEQPDRFKQFECRDGLIFLSNSGRHILCVPDIMVGDRKIRELIISQAHSILAHLGSQKTLYYLKDNVWWPGLTADVKAFCDSCHTCAISKSNTTAPYGLLNPLAVPDRPWDTIGVDFVGPLPESRTRAGVFDMICVVIDHFSNMVHLVPSAQSYRARDIADLMFTNVYKLHGIPRKIISDRDSLFTGQFWDHLNKLVGVDLRRSSAYHPQSDGLTERTNRTLGQMLRQCVSPTQKDWATKLPAIEFALNSARSDSTGFSPFFLNTGRVPRPMIWDSSTQYPGVRSFAAKMKEALLAAHDALLSARVKMTRQANRHRRPAPFMTGDFVYLSTKNLSLPKGRSRKLFPKFIGPFRILQDFGNSTFRLDLPADLRRRGVHTSFHSSLLRVHHANDDHRFPGRQLEQLSAFNDNPREWAVDRIRTHHGAGRTALFELQWKSGDVSWAPYDDVAHLEALGTYLELLGVTGISQLTTGTAPSPTDPELRVSAAGFNTSCYSTYIKHTTSPVQLQLSSLTMPRQWTLAQLRTFATYAELLHAASLGGPAAPTPAPEHYNEWAASNQGSILDPPPRTLTPPGTHVAPHVAASNPNSVATDANAVRTQTMADEWMELGRIAINDMVKNRRASRDTQRGGQSSRGRHSHRGRSHSLYRPRGGQLNHQINVDRAAFYRRQRQFDELPAYVDHRRRSRSPARTTHRHADRSPPRRGRARTPVHVESASSTDSDSDNVVYPKAAASPAPVDRTIAAGTTHVVTTLPDTPATAANVSAEVPTTDPAAVPVSTIIDEAHSSSTDPYTTSFTIPSSSTVGAPQSTIDDFIRQLTTGPHGTSDNPLTVSAPSTNSLNQLPFHPSTEDFLTPPKEFNPDEDVVMDMGGTTGGSHDDRGNTFA